MMGDIKAENPRRQAEVQKRGADALPSSLYHDDPRASTPGPDNYAKVPDELKTRPQWVCWRHEVRNGKPTKIPYQVNGAKASSTDLITWTTFEEAVTAAADPKKKFDGIGFVISGADPYVFIDLDDVIIGGHLTDDAMAIIRDVDSYTEFSPSGTGVHIIARAKKPGIQCGTKESHFEIYDQGRYSTFTGAVIPGCPTEIREAQDAVTALYNRKFLPPAKVTATKQTTPPDMSDNTLIEMALAASNGDKFGRLWNGNTGDYNGDDSAADMALCCLLAFQTNHDPHRVDRLFRQSGLMRDKWDEPRGAQTYGQLTINKAIEFVSEGGNGKKAAADQDDPGPEAADGNQSRPRTDLGNAERLKDAHGDNLLYVVDWKRWLHWDGVIWRQDRILHVHQLAATVARSIYAEAENATDKAERQAIAKFAMASEAVTRLNAMVSLAAPMLPIEADKLDRDPWLLACANGYIDLRTNELVPPRRDCYITKAIPVAYDPAAGCPMWEKFLTDVIPDADTRRYLQLVIGYTLTGSVNEQCLFFCYGEGKNGKTVLTEVITALMGDYAVKAPADMLMIKRPGAISNDVARLAGARMATTTELTEGRRLDEGLVKDLTGGDTQVARFLYSESFNFKAGFKLWLHGNHKPVIHGRDEGIWRRIKLIPFSVQIPPDQQDKDLAEKLQHELPGILNWALDGCREWRQSGLKEPSELLNAVNEYRREQDGLADFLTDCCTSNSDADDKPAAITLKELWAAYTTYTAEAGVESFENKREFNEEVARHPGIKKKTGHGNVKQWNGIRLMTEDERKAAAAARGEE